MSLPVICNFCVASVFSSTKAWDYHHPSYLSLARSARDRCVFCAPLYEDVQEKAGLMMGRMFSEPLYRWSVRSLGRIRESREMVAVTFRVVPRKVGKKKEAVNGGGKEAYGETFGLPERVYYCFPEKDLGSLPGKGDLGVSTNPDANEGAQIKKWIQNCDSNHIHCPGRARHKSTFVPTRLLAIGPKGSRDPIKVLETKRNGVQVVKGPYVTLSHCWGRDPFVNLRIGQYEEFTTVGVPWEELPKNFQQAIEVARFLEVEYMWIDSLCIIQWTPANPAKEIEYHPGDFKEEGQLMHKVYRNSVCNIAAADAEDSKGGLFRKREPYQVMPARLEADGTSPMFGRRVWRIVREDLWSEYLLKTPIYTRGWVFQERMLAPRILHFAHHQIFWDCAEMSACETLPAGLPLPLDRTAAADRHWRGRLQETGAARHVSVSGANDDSTEVFWKAAVENYTGCNLTNQGDKRVAIWGIAKLLRDSLGEEYAAGLWEHALEEQLAWRVSDCTVAERPAAIKINPTWSWTSVKGIILFRDRSLTQRWYTVNGHDGRPISFRTESNARPDFHREKSEDMKEEVVAMSKELDFVAKKREATGRETATPKRMTAKRYDSRGGYDASRDEEPQLLNPAIAVHGYINCAPLHWNKSTGKGMLDLISGTNFTSEDALVEAYPDIKRNTEDGTAFFVILALSHYSAENTAQPSLSDPGEHSWYSGVGIMLRSFDHITPRRYTRTGAVVIQHLSEKMWRHLQKAGRNESEPSREADRDGIRFWLE